jgi:hypothetical protein
VSLRNRQRSSWRADSDAHAYAYLYSYDYPDSNSNCNCNGDSYCYSNSYADNHAHAHDHTNPNPNINTYLNAIAYGHSKACSDSQTDLYTETAPHATAIRVKKCSTTVMKPGSSNFPFSDPASSDYVGSLSLATLMASGKGQGDALQSPAFFVRSISGDRQIE